MRCSFMSYATLHDLPGRYLGEGVEDCRVRLGVVEGSALRFGGLLCRACCYRHDGGSDGEAS
jgi:hypothetical protein